MIRHLRGVLYKVYTNSMEKKIAKARQVVKVHGAKHVNGFKEFIREQGIVGLAIGFVVGAAAATLVKSFVDNVIMPPVGILLGSADGLRGLSASLGEHAGKEVILRYGQFLSDLVNFLILAFVIYVVVKILQLDRIDKRKG